MFVEMMKQLKMIKLVVVRLRSVQSQTLDTKELWLVFAKVFNNVMKKLFPGKSLAKDAISHCGFSIEVKLVTAVDEFKGPDCGNAAE